jgi:hypothetical protein
MRAAAEVCYAVFAIRVLCKIVRQRKRVFQPARVFAGNRFDILLMLITVSSSCFVSPYRCLQTSFAFPVLTNRVRSYINGTGRIMIIAAF